MYICSSILFLSAQSESEVAFPVIPTICTLFHMINQFWIMLCEYFVYETTSKSSQRILPNAFQMLVVVSQQVQSRACWNKGLQNTQGSLN